ncbi:MAG: hypothetical protein GVY28_06970 [Alphaproteobacteria bacterium]|jgi:hypothetical protein|nr:hypothetical protein [Alphaproteobacteria bacterium]
MTATTVHMRTTAAAFGPASAPRAAFARPATTDIAAAPVPARAIALDALVRLRGLLLLPILLLLRLSGPWAPRT